MERGGEVSEYQVAYVIGSGSHAEGYLIQIADHLFQSPICYYTNRRAYDLAPGYERISDPDFTRPVGEECVLCHSGRPLHVAGTANRYTPPVFTEEAISCERCHGAAEEHLRRPVPGSIVNPARLAPAARDSICEQCHLAGVTRILNPGRSFEDFRPGQRLEEVFTVYVRAGARCLQSDQPCGAVGVECLRAQQPGQVMVRNVPRPPSAGGGDIADLQRPLPAVPPGSSCRSRIPTMPDAWAAT